MAVASSDLMKLRRKLEEERNKLLALVSGMTDAERRRKPAPNEWSPHEQLAHLAEMEPIWLEWALTIARNPGAEIGRQGVTPTPSVASAPTLPFSELLAGLNEARATTLAVLDELKLSQLDNLGRHRWFGPMTTIQCLRAIYRHDRMHADQIQGKESSFRLPDLDQHHA